MLKQKVKGVAILSVPFLFALTDIFAFAGVGHALPPWKIITPAGDTNGHPLPQVVCVIGKSSLGVVEGSGFVVAPGYILTSHHGLEKVNALTVQLEEGTRYPAAIFAFSVALDLVLLSFPDDKIPYFSFAKEESTAVGSPISTVGCPFGLNHSITRGIVSAKERTIRERQVFQTDMAINPGNSGGPVLNQRGEVVGVVLGVLEDARGISFALPSREAIRFLGETFSQMGTLFFNEKRYVDASLAFTEAIRFAPRADIPDLKKKRQRALQRSDK